VPQMQQLSTMKAALIALLYVSLLGCASQAPQLQYDQSYRVEWIGERPLIDRSYLSINLGADGRAFGNASCNQWFASYSQTAEQLNFSQAGSTRKLCAPALMEQEQRFLEALGQVQRWDFNAMGQLQLWPASGKPIRLWAE
jgi:heat shock protein HslJ